MKARPQKPSARKTAAKKPAAGKRAAVARKAPFTAKPAKVAAKPGKTARRAKAPAPTALAADCTIEHAPQLQKQLAKVLADRARVTLDFSAVKRCDTAGLQLLAAFIRERREAGGEIELASMPENFLATARLLGLAALFEPAGSAA